MFWLLGFGLVLFFFVGFVFFFFDGGVFGVDFFGNEFLVIDIVDLWDFVLKIVLLVFYEDEDLMDFYNE